MSVGYLSWPYIWNLGTRVGVIETDTDPSGIVKVGAYTFRYPLTGTAPFYVYAPGRQIGVTDTDTHVIVEGDDDYEPIPLQILDSLDTDSPYETLNPSTIVLQWRGDSSHYYYLVEEYVGTTWTQRALLMESGQGYYEYESEPLDDVTSAVWRVTAYDTQENAGRAQEYSILVVRNPAPPQVHITYNPVTGDATASAR